MSIIVLNKKSKRYNFIIPQHETQKCDCCDNIIEYGTVVHIVKMYDKFLGFDKKILCSIDCFNKKCKSAYQQIESISAQVRNIIDQECDIVDDYPAELKSSKIDLFQASMLESDHTTNRTVHAGKPELLGASIGNKKYLTEESSKTELEWSNMKRGKSSQ